MRTAAADALAHPLNGSPLLPFHRRRIAVLLIGLIGRIVLREMNGCEVNKNENYGH